VKETEIHIGIIARISGSDIAPEFGEALLTAFSSAGFNSKEEQCVAAFSCTLFLSAIIGGFPTEKLHIYVRHTRDNCKRLMFDCKMYEKIYSCIPGEEPKKIALLDKKGECTIHECSKQEFFEAFDFYTNQ
jgi:hypothetical protein